MSHEAEAMRPCQDLVLRALVVATLLWAAQVLNDGYKEPTAIWLWVKTNRIPFWDRCATHVSLF